MRMCCPRSRDDRRWRARPRPERSASRPRTISGSSPMPFSESRAARTRDALAREPGITEKKMFGGLSFLLHGKLLVGVFKDSLVARVGPGQARTALKEPHVGVFDITGRPMKGWVVIEPE